MPGAAALSDILGRFGGAAIDNPIRGVERGRSYVLWFCITGLLLTLVVTRVPFYSDYFLPGVEIDTQSYLLIQWGGEWPVFFQRTPGYPLLVAVVTALHESWHSVLLAQSIVTALACIVMIHAAYRTRWYLAAPVTLGLLVYVLSGRYLAWETQILTESIYASSVIFGFACLLVGLRERRAAWLSASAIAFAYAILARPAGLFLVVIVAAAWLFMLYNRYAPRLQLACALPLPVLLVLLGGYNLSVSGAFSLTAVGATNIAAATATFWEQDPSFGAPTNRAIQRMQSRVSDAERETLARSWDLVELQRLFAKHYAYHRFVHEYAFKEWLDSHSAQSLMEREKALRHELSAVSQNAIRSHPSTYLKFVLSNLYVYFFVNSLRDRPFWDSTLPTRFERWRTWVEERRASYVQFFGDYSQQDILAAVNGEADPNGRLLLDDTVVLGMARGLMTRIGAVVGWKGWPIAYGVVAVLSFFQLVRTKARDADVFFVFLLCASAMGAALVVCMVEPALVRYSFVSNFIVYLSVAFSLLLARGAAVSLTSWKPSVRMLHARQKEPPA